MKKLDKKNIEDIIALNPIQQGMLAHYLKNPRSPLYFEQLCLSLSGSLDLLRVEDAWNVVVRDNQALRSVFRWETVTNPIQVILKHRHLEPAYLDLSTESGLEAVKARDRADTFDLHEVPFRVTLCKRKENLHEMIISNHHILYDGWSSGIILKEFFHAYDALTEGRSLPRANKKPLKDFIHWHQNRDPGEPETFWKSYLEYGASPENVDAAGSGGRQGKKRRIVTAAGNYRFPVPGELNRRMTAFVKDFKLTLSTLYYAAWGLLLLEYRDRRDMIFDTTVSGRSAGIKGIDHMVGLFINSLPLRIQTREHETPGDFLRRFNETLQQRQAFENTSPLCVREYQEQYRRYAERADAFDSVVVIENYPLDEQLAGRGGTLTVDSFSVSSVTSYDVTLMVTAFRDPELRFTYNTDRFDEAFIKRLCGHLISVLETMVNGTVNRLPMCRVAFLPEVEKAEMIECFEREHEGEREQEIVPGAGTGGNGTGPRDELDVKLVEIWAEVLNIPAGSIGMDTGFFDFGGHSLKAVLLAAKIHEGLQVKMPLAEIFKHPTIRGMAEYIKHAVKEKYIPIESVEEKEYYPVSSAQERLFIQQQLGRTGVAYNMPSAAILEGTIDKERLEETFRVLIFRHESFRTSFHMIDDEPVQVIHGEVPFEIRYEHGAQAVKTTLKNFVRPFDLSRAPLLRMGLVGLDAEKHILVVDMHHIISDGISTGIFLEEFITLYAGGELLPLWTRYRDYALWQSLEDQQKNVRRQEAFWLKQFEDGVPELPLPVDYPRPNYQSFQGAVEYFEVGPEDTAALKRLAAEQGVTLYMVFLAVFNVLLAKMSGRQDIVIGTPVAGRNHADLESVIGMFVNSLVLRNFPASHLSFARFLEDVKQRTTAAYDNGDYPFADLVKRLALKRDISRNPLYDAAFSFQNPELRAAAVGERRLPGLTLRPYNFDNSTVKSDLVLVGGEAEGKFQFAFEYCTDLFRKETIEFMMESFLSLVKHIIHDVSCTIGELDDGTALEKDLEEIDDIEFKI
jgi:non-ribosomal peptide synthetase component F/acyl carrier protein